MNVLRELQCADYLNATYYSRTFTDEELWRMVTANAAALTLFTAGVSPALLEPPVNVVRLGMHPEGLAPRTRNLAEFSEHLLIRLQRQLAGVFSVGSHLSPVCQRKNIRQKMLEDSCRRNRS